MQIRFGAKVELAGEKGSVARFRFDVPENALILELEVSAGWGDARILLRSGAEPTSTEFDEALRTSAQGKRVIDLPTGGPWFIRVEGKSAGRRDGRGLVPARVATVTGVLRGPQYERQLHEP